MSAEPVSRPEPVLLHPPPADAGMTLLEHLRELRNRVIVCAGAIVVGVATCLFFWETILGWLLAPGRVQSPGLRLASFSPVDRVGAAFKIGMYGGIALASPVIIYELLAFIVPGLTKRERKMIFPALFGFLFFLLSGMAFAYWVVLPLSLGFLLNFGKDNITNVIGVHDYLTFVVRSMFWGGVSFEMPMAMALLGWLGLVTPKRMLQFWRYAIVLIFILACFVVPTPDPIDQTIVSVPLLGLFFLGVLLAWLLQKKPETPVT